MAETKRFGVESVDVKNRPKVMALGIGGAGRNIITTLGEDKSLSNMKTYEVGCSNRLPSLPFIEISKEDMKNAYHSDSVYKLKTPSESEEKILRRIKNTDILFLIAGMGGEMGSWATTTCSRLASRTNIFSISLVAMPFDTENIERRKFALEAKSKVKHNSNILGCFSNSKLLKLNPHLPMTKAFDVMNSIIRLPIQDFNSVVTIEDIPHLKKFCDRVSEFHIGAGYGKGRERGKYASKDALRSPWLEKLEDYETVLTVVTSGTGCAEIEAQDALETIRGSAPKADIMWGLKKDRDIGDRTKVTLLAGK